MKFIQEWLKNSGGKGEKVSCLDPVTVQMIRKQATSEKARKEGVEDSIRDVVEVINKGDFKDKDYIMMPVNDNEDPDRDAGSHWSLLIFRKKDRKFYHYDSISGANDRYARRLIGRMSKADPWFRNELMTVKCPKQNDGHSCGMYTIMNACKIAGSIADLDKGNTEVNNEMEMEVEQRGDVAKTRNWVKDIISIRKDENSRKDVLKTQEMIFYRKQIKECWFHTNRSCKFEEKCINTHKMRCMEHYVKGKCYTKDCKRGHPTICRNIENEGICRNSNRCQYLHPDNYYRHDRRFRNNRKGNNNINMSNNNSNNNNNNINNNNNMRVNHNGYRGQKEWNRGNSTDWNNRNNNGYMKYGDGNRWEQGYERDVNFHRERNYCEQWPTPWEGRILRMLEMRIDKIDKKINENMRQMRW